MNVNLILSILLLLMNEISFGLNFDNEKFCVFSFCLGYYPGKRRQLQVYLEIALHDCIFSF